MEQTFYDWETPLEEFKNVLVDISVNGKVKLENVTISKINMNRSSNKNIKVIIITKEPILSKMFENEKKRYNYEVMLTFKDGVNYYTSIKFYGFNSKNETRSYRYDYVETINECRKINFSTDFKREILREWYGCCNGLAFFHGIKTSKTLHETITYKDNNKISYVINSESYNGNSASFVVKMKDYKFKVTLIKKNDDDYFKYIIEYRDSWGYIPGNNVRHDVSEFLSFVIGTKLVKFGQSYFDKNNITEKDYLVPSPIDISFLYQTNFKFYNDDYRKNDTEEIIKQLPKMLKNYFLLKNKYRLNEVIASLYIHSYLNFNFINYVTYIEMIADIEIKNKNLITKEQFRTVLKKLNKVKCVPKKIKNKFQNLNIIGIGKKTQSLVGKYHINYDLYKDAFNVRGQVVHGADVDIEKMYIASQKAKELLTILTLKKLKYTGYIRNFTNNDELILVKDMSTIRI